MRNEGVNLTTVLVTGATGNVGQEVIESLLPHDEVKVIAAVRDTAKGQASFANDPRVLIREFDFDKSNSFDTSFENVDILFLLRPPHIADVERYFGPLLQSAKRCGVDKVVFLSVHGAERSSVIPHNKIEMMIRSLGFQYIFARASYFMQNLTTTLLPEILRSRTITLPSGNGKFNWIDCKDIGRSIAEMIRHFDHHKNTAFEITGTENKSFREVAHLMSEVTGAVITYNPVNPIRFFFRKRREGLSTGFAFVMTILHFLPRIQPEPKVSSDYLKLTGVLPATLKEFLTRERSRFA
jgi:uncharacterized protein YbjT (DUF2867 family)